MSAGATVSTGSEPATFTILLPANTLLTDTIATAAITANTNFFIILLFFNCEYYCLLILLLNSFASSLNNITIGVPEIDELG